MRISIGILAWNESAAITQTIRSIMTQTLLTQPPAEVEAVEVVCVPNGCTDDTAPVAAKAFAELAPSDAKISARVCEVKRAGKANAWNEFIHHFADQQADFIIMLDADITLVNPQTLWNMVRALLNQPAASVSTPQRVKHIALKERKSVLDRISLGASEIGQSRPAMLAGCLYCVRGELLRKIWLPEGLVGEDAFLCAMIVTDLFTHDTENSKVVRAPDASVMFESYTRLRDVYYNLRRRAITRGINAIMYTYLWAHATKDAPDAGQLIRRRNDEDVDWFRKLVREKVQASGWWVMPPGVFTVRLRSLQYLRWPRRILLLPVALIGTAADAVVHIAANRAIRTGQIKGIWRSKSATASDAGKTVSPTAA